MTTCRHINWFVDGTDTFGIVTCADCNEKIRMSTAVNGTMEYVKALIKELEAIVNIEDLYTTKKPGRSKKDG